MKNSRVLWDPEYKQWHGSGPSGGCPSLEVWKASMKKFHLTRDPKSERVRGLETLYSRETHRRLPGRGDI